MYEREYYKTKENLKSFKKWIESNYEDIKTYGLDEEIGIWQDICDKFDRLFNEKNYNRTIKQDD